MFAALRRRAPLAAILATAALCLLALAFRTPLRARHWAAALRRAAAPAQRSIYLAALCNAGDDARWGATALLADPDPGVRQYGVLVLQHMRSAWSRAQLLAALRDADAEVRSLAALGLALQGDARALTEIETLYRTGPSGAAAAACVALERLGTPAAVALLTALADAPADAERRGALVAALGNVATPACVPPLLALLADNRACEAPLPQEEAALRALAGAQAEWYDARVMSPGAPRTVAALAQAALRRVTGVGPDEPVADPAESAAWRVKWEQWRAAHPVAPALQRSDAR
jgi:hypothetical protein